MSLKRRHEKAIGFLFVTLSVVKGSMVRSLLGHVLHQFNKRTRESEESITSAIATTTPGSIISTVSNGILKLREDKWREIFSLDSENLEKCHIQIRNDSPGTFLVCWVDAHGALYHYYPVNDGSIKDGSVLNKHLEYTNVGHAFIIIKPSDVLPKLMSDVASENFICYYQPLLADFRHELTISRKSLLSFSRSSANVKLRCVPLDQPGKVVDTSKKQYVIENIMGFTVMSEPKVFESIPELRKVLTDDLEMLRVLLPKLAFSKLKKSTKIWVNKSISFGPLSEPIVGNTCTYHPKGGCNWLKANGLREDKCGSVEIYCAQEYLESRGLWGVGGIILHEFCHAYHDQHLKNGFENDIIQQTYNTAMMLKKYDAVPVHGRQGLNGPVKAYACTNCMEFFAELSVAFHWKNDSSEYNKWFPHNRGQLRAHDMETYEKLAKAWGC